MIWATGTIPKSLTQYLSNIPGKHEIKELQTTAILCTAGSADVEVQNMFNGGNNITCGANCKYRTAATLYTVETVCLRCVIVNSVRNGDNRDNNNNNNNNFLPFALRHS